ncbi:hypothetical protein DTW90_32740 [Neorhizobium sp. P12A]|nr:hypothetical protein DTW90_32740 [Neorhizobium sp. P12A]
MGRRRPQPDNSSGPKLKDVRLQTIEVECKPCGLKRAYDRTVLVKLHGASLSFARLRRQAALGCERMTGPDGDRCQTRFPCLEIRSVE